MLTVVDDEWLVDTEDMLCRNNLTNIVVGFVKSGETYIGKIKDMPTERYWMRRKCFLKKCLKGMRK